MAKSGLRLDMKGFTKKIQKKLSGITADHFKPELSKHVKRTLATAVKLTPARNLSVIRRNQAWQYDNRVNYIPSIHELLDPTLIVKDDVYWLYANGRWWAATYRDLPSEIEAILGDLVAERERRLETSVSEFVNKRSQARFLYRKSWWQVSTSLGTPINVSSEIRNSHSRPYHDPPTEPPKGYGQWRGGKHILSVVIYNPFLDRPTKYFRTISGKQILKAAEKASHPKFVVDISSKLRSMLSKL